MKPEYFTTNHEEHYPHARLSGERVRIEGGAA